MLRIYIKITERF